MTHKQLVRRVAKKHLKQSRLDPKRSLERGSKDLLKTTKKMEKQFERLNAQHISDTWGYLARDLKRLAEKPSKHMWELVGIALRDVLEASRQWAVRADELAEILHSVRGVLEDAEVFDALRLMEEQIDDQKSW